MSKCVIVGSGECDIKKFAKRVVIDEDDICIAADGGLNYLMEAGIKPDLVIGDMDSIDKDESLQGFNIKVLPVEKDDTDMLAAIKEGFSRGYGNFELYGALGGRLDHTIANIQCLLYILNNGGNGKISGDEISVQLIKNGSSTYLAEDYKAGSKISVFAYGGDAAGVTEKGLKYSLDNDILRQEFPIGVSNEFTGNDAQISVKDGMLLICAETKEVD